MCQKLFFLYGAKARAIQIFENLWQYAEDLAAVL